MQQSRGALRDDSQIQRGREKPQGVKVTGSTRGMSRSLGDLPREPLKPNEFKQSQSPKIEDDGELVSLEHPVNNKSETKLITIELLKKESFHPIRRVLEKTDSEVKTGFLKLNKPGSSVSELEAAFAGFYKAFADDLIPTTYAVYNAENQYFGVVSEALPGFESIIKKPLEHEYLDVSFLSEKKKSVEEMDVLDNELRNLESEEFAIIRKEIKLEMDFAEIKMADRENQDPDKAVEITREKTTNLLSQANLSRNKEDVQRRKNEFFSRLEQKHLLTWKELQSYRNVKGLSRTLTLSYVFMEDDLHRGNIGPDGSRIDFDMSLFPLSYFFKADIIKMWRKPGESCTPVDYIQTAPKYRVTERDIKNFPNLIDAMPYYWPTRPGEKSVSGSFELKATISSAFSRLKENAYPDNVIPIFQSLQNNPVFVYHKYKMLLKFILTSKELYRNIAKQYIHSERKSLTIHPKPLIDILENIMDNRISLFEAELMKIAEFVEFFKENGEQAKNELIADFRKQKMNFDASLIDTTYQSLKEEITIKNKPKTQLDSKQKSTDANDLLVFDSHYTAAAMTEVPRTVPEREKDLSVQGVVKKIDTISTTSSDMKKDKPVELPDDLKAFKHEALYLMDCYKNPKIPGLSVTHSDIADRIIAFVNTVVVDPEDKQIPSNAIRALHGYLRKEFLPLPAPAGIFRMLGSYASLTDRMHGFLSSLIEKIEIKYPQLKIQPVPEQPVAKLVAVVPVTT